MECVICGKIGMDRGQRGQLSEGDRERIDVPATHSVLGRVELNLCHAEPPL